VNPSLSEPAHGCAGGRIAASQNAQPRQPSNPLQPPKPLAAVGAEPSPGAYTQPGAPVGPAFSRGQRLISQILAGIKSTAGKCFSFLPRVKFLQEPPRGIAYRFSVSRQSFARSPTMPTQEHGAASMARRETQHQERKMSSAEVASGYVRRMVENETRGWGDTDNALNRLEAKYGLPFLEPPKPPHGPRQDGRSIPVQQDQGSLRRPLRKAGGAAAS
jgi:hypothetical protein